MVGGLARVDVLESPGATLYLTVFASDEIGCHMGKTETAEERCAAKGSLALGVLMELAHKRSKCGCMSRPLAQPQMHAACRPAPKPIPTVPPACFPRCRRYALHAGGKLAPPLGGAERLESWPSLVPTDVEVAGDSWKGSSADVAIAGAWEQGCMACCHCLV